MITDNDNVCWVKMSSSRFKNVFEDIEIPYEIKCTSFWYDKSCSHHSELSKLYDYEMRASKYFILSYEDMKNSCQGICVINNAQTMFVYNLLFGLVLHYSKNAGWFFEISQGLCWFKPLENVCFEISKLNRLTVSKLI